LREAYRLEKPTFLAQFSLEHKRVNLFFLYGNAEILTQAEIQDKVRSALALLAQKLNAN
jgi:hypothetical protein